MLNKTKEEKMKNSLKQLEFVIMKTVLSTRVSIIAFILVFITSFSQAQNWHFQNSNHSGQITGIQMISNNEGWACGDAGSILHTSDAGETWSVITLTGADLHQIVFKDANTGIVVGDGGAIFVTTNSGVNWISKNSGTTAQLRGASFAGGSTFYAVGRDGAAVKSTDDGNTWSTLVSGTIERLLCVFAIGEKVWVGARNGLMLYSNNGGLTFTNMINPTSDDIKDIQFINESIGFACGSNSFFMYTSDSGTNWISRSSGILFGLNGLHFIDANKGWTVGGAGTLYSTTNAGVNWLAEQSGTGQDLNSIHSFDGVSGWAVGNLGVIVTNFFITTGLENPNNIIPNSLIVEQNYPNPFNPSTKISFNLPSRDFVTLKVYNLLGSEIATLLSEDISEGFHEVEFDATEFNSGVYFYTINSGKFTETRKMILLK